MDQERPKIAFIINPNSGTSKKKKLPEKIKAIVDSEKVDAEIYFTEYAGHGREMAAEMAKKGYYCVVACGGDGTVNEIGSAVINTGTAMGIVPMGSGNGLARHLGIPMNTDEAIRQVCENEPTDIDYGTANERPFFCTCGTGFDAHISHAFSKDGKRGLWTYAKTTIKEYWKYKPYTYELETNSITITQKAFLVTFANASQYGNNAYIAPNASTRDGEMEVCIMKPFTVFAILNVIARIFTRQIENSRYFAIARAKEVTLRRENEGEFHIDGDPIMEGKEIKVRIHPKCLKVIAGEKRKSKLPISLPITLPWTRTADI